MSSDFVHLHVHSDYSVLDGACKVNDLLDRCEEYGMNHCALTDHGNIFGAVEFYAAAKKRGINPIIGSELYVSKTTRFDKSARSSKDSHHHLLLLCENEIGYHNLCRLSSLGYLEGWHYKPRIDDDILAKHKEGLIVSSACLGGRIPQAILKDELDAARDAVAKYVEIFGKDNFLIEVMDHGMPEEEKVNPVLAQLAEDFDLMMIATNDCHYLGRDDAEAHEALLCVQTQTNLLDEKRFRFPNSEFYFRSGEEMEAKFTQWPEALSNTKKIAERCKVEIPLNQHLIPAYDVPEGKTASGYLEELVMAGVERRYGAPPAEEYVKRAKYELAVINEMQFVDYFLVVWDLINYANENNIPVGPGRGSGAGSIVAYALRITNIDPMRYGLLFERFLNPERVSMPDFDIDFCYNKREKMIEYSYAKYGKENVSQIITFGRMLAKNVVRNVGRVLGMPYGDVDRIAKLIPDELKITLKSAVEKEPELKKIIEDDPQVAKLWDLATRLEGTIGNCGTHAAGVVICDHPITDHVGLFKAASSDTVATQVEMKWVEEVGLLKMDFLGLRTLTVVHEAVRLLKESRGIEIDIDNLEPNDAKTYQLLRSGQTTGVFQLESSGMRELAKRIGLQSLEEICALVALYRPGPMQFIDTYIENKFNPDKITYDHPKLKTILEETYGIAIYQEQVMQIVQACGGFSLGQADIVRRAMGKKKKDLLDEQCKKFIEGCKENDIDEKLAKTIWDKIETFAGYGFNKSHSMAYAFVAYQTAFLKANYPEEFMSALLTSESGNLDKVALYVEECRLMNIKVLPPEVNRSHTDFTVDKGEILFGMCAVKNVGEAATDAIVAERVENGPFKDIFDFCARLDKRQVNQRLIESLNKAGAFRSTEWNRHQVQESIESAIMEGQSAQRDRDSGQVSLFDMEGMEDTVAEMHQKPELDEWPTKELLLFEKEVLGLYASSHPLESHTQTLDRFSTLKLAELGELQEGTEVNIGGLISAVKTFFAKRGKMAFLTMETLQGNCELTVFSDLYEARADLPVNDAIVMIQARVNYRNGEAGLIANTILPLEESPRYLSKAVHVRLLTDKINGNMQQLAEVLGKKPGPCDVYLHCYTPESDEITIHATSACQTVASTALHDTLEAIVGPGNVWFSAGMGLPSHTPPTINKPDVPKWKRNKQRAEG
jgi:DNA polymerase-3 subunit alpha